MNWLSFVQAQLAGADIGLVVSLVLIGTAGGVGVVQEYLYRKNRRAKK